MLTATQRDREDIQLTGPYDSMREYVNALEATGATNIKIFRRIL